MKRLEKLYASDLPVNIHKYRSSACPLSTKEMQTATNIDEIVRSRILRAAWFVIDWVDEEYLRLRTVLNDNFNIRIFMIRVNKVMKRSAFLPIVENRDGTISLIRPVFFGLARAHLFDFNKFIQYTVTHDSPLGISRIRPWHSPADVIVEWWASHLPDLPLEAATTRTELELLHIFSTVDRGTFTLPEKTKKQLEQREAAGHLRRWW